MGAEGEEIARDPREHVRIDLAREQFPSADVRRGTGADPICHRSDAIGEAVREGQRADEDHASEGDRPSGHPGPPGETRREAQDGAGHVSARWPRLA